jgi:hypothetical protein
VHFDELEGDDGGDGKDAGPVRDEGQGRIAASAFSACIPSLWRAPLTISCWDWTKRSTVPSGFCGFLDGDDQVAKFGRAQAWTRPFALSRAQNAAVSTV